MKQQHKANPVSQLLAEVPGIGPIGALSLALTIDPGRFQSGRHFAAWLGLTPKEHSTGGRQRLGGISRAGNERLRQVLVLGAMAVIRYAKPGSETASPWLFGIAGAQAAQARGGGSGQQDGPHRVGHDGDRGSVSGQSEGRHAGGRSCRGRLTRSQVPGCKKSCRR